MSVAAQAGVLSFAEQPNKAVDKATFDGFALNWYRTRTPRIALGPIQDQQVFPPETGGPLTPDGAYKQMKMYGGETDLLPRVEGSLGILMKAAFGRAEVATGVDADGTVVAGVNTHTFSYDPTDNSAQPWLAVRCLVPGGNSTLNSGDVGFDCKVSSMRLTIPAMGKVAARLQIVGRDFFFENEAAVNAWAYANTFEDPFSVPDAGNGSFKLGTSQYPVTAVQVEMDNGLTRPQDEMVIGSFSPDDFKALSRPISINFVYKYDDPTLLRQAMTNADAGTEWSPLPRTIDTVGSDYALEGRFYSPGVISGTSKNFGLILRANRVTVTPSGPLELQAGGIVTQNFTAQILNPDAGEDYFQILLENAEAAY